MQRLMSHIEILEFLLKKIDIWYLKVENQSFKKDNKNVPRLFF